MSDPPRLRCELCGLRERAVAASPFREVCVMIYESPAVCSRCRNARSKRRTRQWDQRWNRQRWAGCADRAYHGAHYRG